VRKRGLGAVAAELASWRRPRACRAACATASAIDRIELGA
jgi:hypothetical protein